MRWCVYPGHIVRRYSRANCSRVSTRSSGRLDDLHAELIRLAVRHAGRVTMQLRLVRHVVHDYVLLLRPGFRFIRDLAIGRIDDAVARACKAAKPRNRSTAPATRGRRATGRRRSAWSTAAARCTAAGASTAACGCRFNISNCRRIPESLHVRMPVRQPGHGARGGRRRTASPSALRGERGRESEGNSDHKRKSKDRVLHSRCAPSKIIHRDLIDPSSSAALVFHDAGRRAGLLRIMGTTIFNPS